LWVNVGNTWKEV